MISGADRFSEQVEHDMNYSLQQLTGTLQNLLCHTCEATRRYSYTYIGAPNKQPSMCMSHNKAHVQVT